MTLQDYAKYLLSACGRRFTNLYRRHYLESTNALPSLSVLLSYLRTQTASIYTHLLSRGCTQSTPTFANLLPTIHQLDGRKIEVYDSLGIADGESLVRLLSDSTIRNQVTILDDESSGWTMISSGIFSYFPNLNSITIGCQSIDGQLTLSSSAVLTNFSAPNVNLIKCCSIFNGCTNITTINFPLLETVNLYTTSGWSHGYHMFNNIGVQTLILPEFKYFNGSYGSSWYLFANLTNCTYVCFPKLITFGNNQRAGYTIHYFGNCPNLIELHLPSLVSGFPNRTYVDTSGEDIADGCPKLILWEFANGFNSNIYISKYNPTIALMSDPTSGGYENLVTQSIVDELNATLEEGQTQYTLADFPNNLKLFIENFYVFFAKRLQSQTTAGAKTLRLSSAVATAINATAKDGTNVYTYITSIKKWTIATA